MKNVSSLFFFSVECSSILHVNMLFTIYKVVTVVYISDNKRYLIENWVILSQNVCVKLSKNIFFFLFFASYHSTVFGIDDTLISDLSRYKKYVDNAVFHVLIRFCFPSTYIFHAKNIKKNFNSSELKTTRDSSCKHQMMRMSNE